MNKKTEKDYDMLKCTLHFILAIIGAFLFIASITAFQHILSSKFLASNVIGLLILLIGFFLTWYSLRFVFKTSLLAFQWLCGILVLLVCASLSWHQSASFIAIVPAAITVYIISKYRHRINDNQENTFSGDIAKIWSIISYWFIVDDIKIMKSDKKLLRFSIIYKIIYWVCICIMLYTCVPLFRSLLIYSLKSSASNMTSEAYMGIVDGYMKLLMRTSFFPILIGTMAYFRMRHIQSIKFYRKRLNLNS
jgi:uncharacterized membrane protein (GlpM family)